MPPAGRPSPEILTCNFGGWDCVGISELAQRWGLLLSAEEEPGRPAGHLAPTAPTRPGDLGGQRWQKGRHHFVDVVAVCELSKPSVS